MSEMKYKKGYNRNLFSLNLAYLYESTCFELASNLTQATLTVAFQNSVESVPFFTANTILKHEKIDHFFLNFC